jgi:hypothetical protein
MNFFLKGGLGFSSIGVAMGYKNPEDYIASNLLDPIYVKGQAGIRGVTRMVHCIWGLGLIIIFHPVGHWFLMEHCCL